MFLSCIALLLASPQSPVASAPVEVVAPAVDPFHAWGLAVDAQMATLDGTLLRESWSAEAMLRRVIEKLGLTDEERARLKGKFNGDVDLAAGIILSVQQFDGSYSFLRVLPSGRALFRMESDRGLNYHELVLSADDQGVVRVIDVLPHASGELMSDTFARSVRWVAQPEPRGRTVRELAQRERFGAIALFMWKASSKPKEALAGFAKLSKKVQAHHQVQLSRVLATGLDSSAASREALADFARVHPKSPALRLLQLERGLLTQDVAACRSVLDELDAELDDGYLDLVRARTYGLESDYAKAKELIGRALMRDPRLDYQASWAGVEIALATRDHDRTLALLLALEADYGIDWGQDLTGVPRFGAFAESAQYQRWLKRDTGDTGADTGDDR